MALTRCPLTGRLQSPVLTASLTLHMKWAPNGQATCLQVTQPVSDTHRKRKDSTQALSVESESSTALLLKVIRVPGSMGLSEVYVEILSIGRKEERAK